MSKFKVILDTDIGDDIDDAFALGALICSKDISLEAITVNTGILMSKALIARKMLDISGMKEVPVYLGLPGPDPNKEREQAEWSRTYKPEGIIAENGIDELVKRAAASPGEIDLLAIGPLTNIGAALDKDPNFGKNLKSLIIMGGSVVHGYEYGGRSAEYNIVHDVAASKKVFSCGANLIVVPLDVTNKLQVSGRRMAQLATYKNALCDAIIELSTLSDFEYPTMHDPRTCAVLFDDILARGVDMCLEVSDDGFTNHVDGKPNCKVVIDPQKDHFFEVMWERLKTGPAV